MHTDDYILSDKPSPVEQFPMREWSLKVFLVDEDGNERPADVFTKVVYNLHPTFENPVQSKSNIYHNDREVRDADESLLFDRFHKAPVHMQERGMGRV